ncbi:MAG: redoxin family protein [Candidatus Kaiserbacteria bacterium]|nr:redoxin family protein [Candidatus Kaiserbacteria bacterium]MCB9816801.1 redoxin family protein [Candidatus Nomurabacteria bacterium]
MTLLLISFIAGALTVLAPCILPLLPVVIGGSATDHGNRWKPYIITASLALSVIVFTLLLKATTLVIDIPPAFWKWFSGGILLVLGIVLIFPSLWEGLKFNAILNSRSQVLLNKGSKQNSVWGDVIMGAALGPVFSTCSPTYFVILATVLPSSFALGMVYLFSYTLGLALVLVLIALLGQKLVGRLSGAADPRGWVKRGMGVLIALVGFAIISGLDKQLETAILDSGFFDVTKIEQRLLEKTDMPDDMGPVGALKDSADAPTGPQAPELAGISAYLNTSNEPITLEQFQGEKIVLVDFWTYSCINCRRTLPYLNTWYERYHDQGLEIVGVHTPEFAFEQQTSNVEQAIADFGIKYPVVLDNDYSTWRAFGNKFWPRKYLINEKGQIIYDHIGEGAYDETEAEIQAALAQLGKTSAQTVGGVVGVTAVDFASVGSPEVYFGSKRNEYLGNGTKHEGGVQTLSLPTTFSADQLYLDGTWNITSEYAETRSAGELVYTFTAKNVYMVLGSGLENVAEVYLDGQPISLDQAGADVAEEKLMVSEERMYHIYTSDEYGTHELRLKVEPGFRAYTFTFG